LPDDAASLNQCIAAGKPLQILNPKHPYLRGIEDSVRLVTAIESKGEKSKVGRAPVSQPLEALKPMLPFTFGNGQSGAGKIPEAGSTPKAIVDRDLAIRLRVHDRLLELVDLRQMDPTQLEKDPKKKEELRNTTIQAIQRLMEEEAKELLTSDAFRELKNVRIAGLMGMASNTDDEEQIRREFRRVKKFFDELTSTLCAGEAKLTELSRGMSSDYLIAVEEGSTLVRVGSAIFGSR
jgi:hypothetical protein